MTKKYTVQTKTITYCTVVVEAESLEDAAEQCWGEIELGNAEDTDIDNEVVCIERSKTTYYRSAEDGTWPEEVKRAPKAKNEPLL